jgi:thiosulfate dehydrogenase [quinone] large subunit
MDHRATSHLLGRLCLGVNIALHGLTRLPHPSIFIAHLEKQFASSALPLALVDASAWVIIFGEAIVGLLLLLGLFQAYALAVGLGLMLLLQFGTALIQDWNTAGLQLPYVLLYGALLATLAWDRYSLDAALGRRRSSLPSSPPQKA